ncbi:MAG TPA: DsbA family protein [Candidatus Micrarchaeaceae archaeon]|nr:DsbA family protein [Candidatus Micrarchaeaceae archaeon]
MAAVEPILNPTSARQLDVFFDYLCPFVYRASVLLQNVKDSGKRPLDIRWRYFSLMQANAKVEGFTIWDAADSEARGRLAFKAAEAARRQEAFDALHMALLRARHEQRADIDDVAVVEQLAEDSGLDLDRFRQDMADPQIVSALERDHRAAVADYGVFGTPTLVFGTGAAAYIRLSEPPAEADSVAIFDRLISIAAEEPRIIEIKRPVKPAPA